MNDFDKNLSAFGLITEYSDLIGKMNKEYVDILEKYKDIRNLGKSDTEIAAEFHNLFVKYAARSLFVVNRANDLAK